MISENQGLEKSRSISNPRKISGSANLDFFFQVSILKKLGLYYKPKKTGTKTEKKSRFVETFLGFVLENSVFETKQLRSSQVKFRVNWIFFYIWLYFMTFVALSSKSHHGISIGLLICTLISENQGLEKYRSISNPRKVSGSTNLDFFQVWHLDFFQVYSINPTFLGWRPGKKIKVCSTLNFSRVWKDLDFSRPQLSKSGCRLKVQLKFHDGFLMTELQRVKNTARCKKNPVCFTCELLNCFVSKTLFSKTKNLRCLLVVNMFVERPCFETT